MNEKALQAAVLSRLQSDATLRTLLGTTAAPWDVYRAGCVVESPSFPIITIEWGDSSTDDMGPSEKNQQLLTVTVYSGGGDGDIEAIHARVRRLLRLRVQPLSVTGISVDRCSLMTKGSELFDPDFRVHYRPDTYLLAFRIYGNLS